MDDSLEKYEEMKWLEEHNSNLSNESYQMEGFDDKNNWKE